MIEFSIPGAKAGRTQIHCWIGPAAFGELAAAMMGGSASEAEEAFLSAMLERRKFLKGSPE
jgi:hypothetical protein